MNIMVTGSEGFIGSAVVRQLTGEGDDVSGVVRGHRHDENGARLITCDITSDSAFQDVKQQFDAVVHCAGLAHQPLDTAEQRFFDVNVLGTQNVARFAAENRVLRFIHISSVSVYGTMGYGDIATEESTCRPESPYARSKLKSEYACREILAESGTELTILRPATVIGEGDRGNVFRLIKLLDSGFFTNIGDGRNLKSFVYVNDVAEAVSAVLKCCSRKHDVYNVAAEPVSVDESVRVIALGLGRNEPKIRIPNWSLHGSLGILRAFARFSKIQKMEGALRKWIAEDVFEATRIHEIFVPRVSAQEALKRETEWYKRNK